MSTVVYRDGTLAADGKAYGGKGQASPGIKVKARRLSDGTRVGVVTAIIGQGERFMNWLEGGGDPTAWGEGPADLRAIVVRPDGGLYLYDDGLWPSGPIQTDRYAIGSGSDFAMAAMLMGADAVRAVEIASTLDMHSGGPVTVLVPDQAAVEPAKLQIIQGG